MHWNAPRLPDGDAVDAGDDDDDDDNEDDDNDEDDDDDDGGNGDDDDDWRIPVLVDCFPMSGGKEWSGLDITWLLFHNIIQCGQIQIYVE